jgi:uncharacterized protein YqeY
MLRDEFNDALKAAMKEKDQVAVSTLRLIRTAIKDRDIAVRGKGERQEITDQEILQVLQTMVRQRQESIALYEQGGRKELAEREAAEVEIIQRFLPKQMSEEETAAAISEVVQEVGAAGIKDMGRTMGVLRERYAGQMDFGKASAELKKQLNAL